MRIYNIHSCTLKLLCFKTGWLDILNALDVRVKFPASTFTGRSAQFSPTWKGYFNGISWYKFSKLRILCLGVPIYKQICTEHRSVTDLHITKLILTNRNNFPLWYTAIRAMWWGNSTVLASLLSVNLMI